MDHPDESDTVSAKVISLIILAILLAIGVVVIANFWRNGSVKTDPTSTLRPPIQIEIGKVHPPLKYRIVSFHRGRADKRLIRLASELGFNGVQFQIEGSTVQGIKDFAKRDADEHLVDFCHSLNMKVTLWVHEMSDVPAKWLPESLGPVDVGNSVLWAKLDDRYETMLRDQVPNVDGLTLTVVETDQRATNTPVLLKLAALLRAKCDKYKKELQVRTFVWYPEEFATVMAAISQLPADQVIMSKCIPQDWQMRGTDASELGNVGGRPQIEEYDIEGEYWMRNRVANCMPALLKRQFDYGTSKNVVGICVRVDRDDSDVIQEPSEVNLWTLGMLASGASDNLDEIWQAWATNRYSASAAEGVRKALEPTGDVVAEMFSIGSFTFGETRQFPPLGDEDVFGQLQQNWWWDKKFSQEHEQAEHGDPGFIAKVQQQKVKAEELAANCLLNLEAVKDQLTAYDYAILKTKLLTNQAQLAYRAPMALAVLHFRAMVYSDSPTEKEDMNQEIQQDLAQLRDVVMPIYEWPKTVQYLGKSWDVGVPTDVNRDAIYKWAYQMDQLRNGEDPRVGAHRPWTYLKVK